MRSSGAHRSKQPRYAAARDGGVDVQVHKGGCGPNKLAHEHQEPTEYLAEVMVGGRVDGVELAMHDRAVQRRTEVDTGVPATMMRR
jgi:hypothetical protein